jgi:rubredoxin
MSPTNYRYCPQCAAELETRIVFGKPRPVCPQCGFIYFADPKVAAHNDRAERFNDVPTLPASKNQLRRRDTERKPEKSRDEKQRRKNAELQRIGDVHRREQNHHRGG